MCPRFVCLFRHCTFDRKRMIMSISSLWSDPRFSSDLLPPISLNSNWCWNLFIQRCIKCFIFRCVNRMIIMITFVVSYAWINLMFHFSVKELFHSNLYLIKTVSSITEKFLGFLISIFAAMKVRTFSYHFFSFRQFFFLSLLFIARKMKSIRVMTDLLSSHFSHYYRSNARKYSKNSLFLIQFDDTQFRCE